MVWEPHFLEQVLAAVICCPEPEVLQRLLSGQLAEPQAEQLTQHLEQCAHCGEVMEKLLAGDTLLEAMRSHQTAPDISSQSAVQGLMARLSDLRRLLAAPRGETNSFRSRP
jgi:hypothetical protein